MVAGNLTSTVDVERLKAVVEQNRARHSAAYEKAKAGYVKITTEQLKGHIERLANGELLEATYIPAPPEDHTKDYDNAIEMLRWTNEKTIELDQKQFRQYVQDDWGWREQWLLSNTAYVTAAPR